MSEFIFEKRHKKDIDSNDLPLDADMVA